jgi:hypothetical protein
VATGTGSNFATGVYYRIGSSDEIVKVTGIASDTLTVERGAANSIAQAHDTGQTLASIVYRWRVIEHQLLPHLCQYRITLQELPLS